MTSQAGYGKRSATVNKNTKVKKLMKRQLTEAQKAKRDERRAQFRAMWKQVAAMPELERIQLSNKYGFVTCEGHAFSLGNSMLLALQSPRGSVFGGFRQWIKHGRCVRKGEHGSMIWVPTGGAKNNVPLDGSAGGVSAVGDVQPTGDNDTRFIIGTVFDISQTDEIANNPDANDAIVEHAGNLVPA